jgi:ketosteroid isomerase-like protein
MKKSTLQFALVVSWLPLVFFSCEMSTQQPQMLDVEQTILDKETKALDFWSAGDPVRFGEGFAEDATYFDDIAASNRVDSLPEIKNYFASLAGKITPHEFTLVDPKVQVYGDIAILTLQYHPTVADTIKGPPWKATSIYRFQDGDWKVVHAHWSLVKE